MTIFDVIILGIVEGTTEFLPVSSTAHLMMTVKLLDISLTDFIKSFEIIIQSGAIGAVCVLYVQTLIKNIMIVKKILIAFIPTGIVGFILYKLVKGFLLGNFYLIIGTLALGGIGFIIFELWYGKKAQPQYSGIDEIASMSYTKACMIGLAQSLAIVPGVSRSGATIVAGMLSGLSRSAAVEFSFLLAFPTIAAATGYDILKNAETFSRDQIGLLALGFLVSAVSAFLAMKFFLNFVRNHNFVVFGVYRIIIAILFFLVIL